MGEDVHNHGPFAALPARERGQDRGCIAQYLTQLSFIGKCCSSQDFPLICGSRRRMSGVANIVVDVKEEITPSPSRAPQRKAGGPRGIDDDQHADDPCHRPGSIPRRAYHTAVVPCPPRPVDGAGEGRGSPRRSGGYARFWLPSDWVVRAARGRSPAGPAGMSSVRSRDDTGTIGSYR